MVNRNNSIGEASERCCKEPFLQNGVTRKTLLSGKFFSEQPVRLRQLGCTLPDLTFKTFSGFDKGIFGALPGYPLGDDLDNFRQESDLERSPAPD